MIKKKYQLFIVILKIIQVLDNMTINKAYKNHTNTHQYKNFFTNLILNCWNKLPIYIVNSSSLNIYLKVGLVGILKSICSPQTFQTCINYQFFIPYKYSTVISSVKVQITSMAYSMYFFHTSFTNIFLYLYIILTFFSM